MKYAIGVDLGSSGCKVSLLSERGAIAATAERPIATYRPAPGIVEQDADEWYRAACAAVADCVGRAKVDSKDVACIAVAGGAHSFVALGSAFRPLGMVMHWSDLRSAEEAEQILRADRGAFYDTTLQPINSASVPARLEWTRRHRPDMWSSIRVILTAKDYLRYRFTGAVATDPYDAAGLQLYDLRKGRWSSELCRLAGVREGILPEIRSSVSFAGELSDRAAVDTGMKAGTPVAVGCGDSAVEAAAAGSIVPGRAVIKLGTSANVEVVLAEPTPVPAAMVYPHVIDAQWIAVAATNSGAATLRWFQDTFPTTGAVPSADHGSYAADVALTRNIDPGSDGVLFLPFLAGERSPYWDSRLRAAFLGVRGGHTRGHLLRAVMEGVAYSIRDCLESSKLEILGTPRLCGGGARLPVWRQIVSDVLGMELMKPALTDASVGSCMLAGIIGGLFAGWDEALDRYRSEEEPVTPASQRVRLYEAVYRIYKEAVTANKRISALLERTAHYGEEAR